MTASLISEQLKAYWACVERLSADVPETLAAARAFLADDCVIRFGDLPLETSGEEMLIGLAADNDLRWITRIEPIYLIVDECQERAAAHIVERLLAPETGEPLRQASYFTHIKYRTVDGHLKIESEHLVEVPSKFKLDSLPAR